MMEIGSKESDERLEESLRRIVVNECCTIVYTVIIFYLNYIRGIFIQIFIFSLVL